MSSQKTYVPPSLRKQEVAKPKTLEADDLKSTDEFPTLGRALPAGGAAKWQQIRERLAAPAPKQENTFAALDDEDDAATTTTAAPLNFKTVIEERIKQDAAEAAAASAPITEDPLEMTPEQLTDAGWATLPLPGGHERAQRIQEIVAKWQPPKEEPDFYDAGDDFEVVGIPLTLPTYSINAAPADAGDLLGYYTQQQTAPRRAARPQPLTERLLARARAAVAVAAK